MNCLYVLRTGTRSAGMVSLQPNVRHEPVPTALAPHPALLVATERAARIELVERVGPHHAGLQRARHLEDFGALAGPPPATQPVGRVVGLEHRLFGGAEGLDRQHRPEDLLLGDAMR